MDDRFLNQNGFTIIEMVMVIAIIGILAISAVSIIPPRKTIQLEARAQQLVNDIRYVQALSMSRHQRYRLDLSNSTQYEILNGNGNSFVWPTIGSSIVELGDGITFSCSINGSPCANYLVFDALGIPYLSASSSENGSAITDIVQFTLTEGVDSEIINVIPETGYVSMSS